MGTAIDRIPENINFLSNIKFTIAIKRLMEVQYFCQSVSIPGVAFPYIKQSNPNVNIKIQGDHLVYEELEIIFKVDEYLNNYLRIYEWMTGITFPKTTDQFKELHARGNRPFGELYSDITVDILSSKFNPICSFNFIDCFPIELSTIKLNTTETDVDFITAQAKFAYTRFEYDQLPPVVGIAQS